MIFQNNFKITAVLILLFSSIPKISLSQQNIISPNGHDMTLRTFNFCQYHADFIICNGDSTQIPTVGWGGCQSNRFFHRLDSCSVLDSIYFFEIDPTSLYPSRPKVFCIGNENMLLTFNYDYEYAGFCDTPLIQPIDTLILDSIAGTTVSVFNSAVIRKSASTDNFFVYDSTFSNLEYSMQLDMVPLFIESNMPRIIVVGLDSGNSVRINVFDVDLQMLIKDTLIGNQFSDVIAIKEDFNKVYLVCEPGDSIVQIVRYDFITGAFDEHIAYHGSGVNAGILGDYTYFFQPFSDTSGNNRHLEVISLYLGNFQQSITNSINTRVDKMFITNTDFSIDQFLNLQSDSYPDQLFVYDFGMSSFIDTINTDPYPSFMFSDLRCTIGIDEYDDSKLEWIAYPNPSGEEINIAASGLICGKDYTIDIVNLQGNVMFKTTVQAKMQITLPVSSFYPGVYFVRIHSLKGMVAKKIVKL